MATRISGGPSLVQQQQEIASNQSGVAGLQKLANDLHEQGQLAKADAKREPEQQNSGRQVQTNAGNDQRQRIEERLNPQKQAAPTNNPGGAIRTQQNGAAARDGAQVRENPKPTSSSPGTRPAAAPAAGRAGRGGDADLLEGPSRGARRGADEGVDAEKSSRNGKNPGTQSQQRSSERKTDDVVDPSRLLLSLVAGGFPGGGRGDLADALKNFQQSAGLPQTSRLDAATREALASQGLLPEQGAGAPPEKPQKQSEAAPKNNAVKRALADGVPTEKAQEAVDNRPQAASRKSDDARANDGASSRAFQADVSKDQVVKDKARLDTVAGEQAPTTRGVQEGKGDVEAKAGQGVSAGKGAGAAGAGGVDGGLGAVDGEAEAHGVPDETAGPEGLEDNTANSKAGDDDFANMKRGHAQIEEDADAGEGHYEIPSLSSQLADALQKIARDDGGRGAVTYSWDVTFYKPGIYAAKQPAEALWHVAVKTATAFDPVWQTAVDALASRMSYIEPDSDPPTVDDFVAALRRARVRDEA